MGNLACTARNFDRREEWEVSTNGSLNRNDLVVHSKSQLYVLMFRLVTIGPLQHYSALQLVGVTEATCLFVKKMDQ